MSKSMGSDKLCTSAEKRTAALPVIGQCRRFFLVVFSE
jgi:hypothetical protein